MSEFLIETPRLLMRKFTLDDAGDVLLFSTHPDVVKYTGDAGKVKTKQDALDVIQNIWLNEYAKYGYARYALIHKADYKLIGFCGVKYEPDLNGVDIGYRMFPEYWGLGLATEAVKATLNYAKETLNLSRLIGEVVDKNTGSEKVLLKSGFEKVESYQKDGFLINRFEIELK